MREASAALDDATALFAAEIHESLRSAPRQLPSHYRYDPLGSALFEAIGELPWYWVTRAERDLLARHAPDICNRASRFGRIIELGPGPGEKLATLLKSALAHGQLETPLEVHLIDLSEPALDRAARTLSAIPGVEIFTHNLGYEEGLTALASSRAGQTLVLWLGSAIGNVARESARQFLQGVRTTLAGGDLLLVGADLVKPERDMLLAYDDPLGVNRAFNLNLLCRINNELGGNFEVDRYLHRASWNPAAQRVETHLISRATQRVRIPAAEVDLTIDEGESIWTGSSYKFEPADIVAPLREAGFELAEQWIDRERGFALTLGRADAVQL